MPISHRIDIYLDLPTYKKLTEMADKTGKPIAELCEDIVANNADHHYNEIVLGEIHNE